jgi:hypothetical protein
MSGDAGARVIGYPVVRWMVRVTVEKVRHGDAPFAGGIQPAAPGMSRSI